MCFCGYREKREGAAVAAVSNIAFPLSAGSALSLSFLTRCGKGTMLPQTTRERKGVVPQDGPYSISREQGKILNKLVPRPSLVRRPADPTSWERLARCGAPGRWSESSSVRRGVISSYEGSEVQGPAGGPASSPRRPLHGTASCARRLDSGPSWRSARAVTCSKHVLAVGLSGGASETGQPDVDNAVSMGGPEARWLISDAQRSIANEQRDWSSVCRTPVMLTAKAAGALAESQAPASQRVASERWRWGTLPYWAGPCLPSSAKGGCGGK